MAILACDAIGEGFDFVQQVFWAKYKYRNNPLRDAEFNWENTVGFGDSKSLNFVRSVANLVNSNSKFLSTAKIC